MSRIDRGRFDAAAFPVTIEVATRFDDLDVQGHVNNAAAAVILQEARVRFNRQAGLSDGKGELRTLVASLLIEYAAELHYPASLDVSTGIMAIGRTSYTLAQTVRQSGRTGLYAQAVMVIADEQGPLAMPDRLREAFERLRLA